MKLSKINFDVIPQSLLLTIIGKRAFGKNKTLKIFILFFLRKQSGRISGHNSNCLLLI